MALKLVSKMFGAKAVEYALAFATSVLIARALGPSDKGVLSFATLIISWTVTFGNLSFMDANIYLMGRGRWQLGEALGSSLLVSLGSGVVYAGLLGAAVLGEWVRWPVGQPVVFAVLVGVIPFTLVMNNALGLLQGLGQFERYARFTIARAALLLAGIGAATVLQPRQLLPLVSAMIVANAIIAVAIVASLTRRCATPITISRDYLREAFRYGLRGHARILLVHITMRLDQFVLGARLAPEYLGWYSVAVALSEAMLMLPDSVGMVLFPKTAQNPAQAPALGARACRATVAVMVLAAAGVFLIAGWVVPLVYGEAFSPAVTPLRVLVWAVVLQAISRVLRNFFYGVGRPQVSIWSTGAAAVTTLIVLFPLVSRYGLLGAAAASVISHAVAATVDLGWARRISGQALGEFLILRVADVQALPGLRRIFSGGDS